MHDLHSEDWSAYTGADHNAIVWVSVIPTADAMHYLIRAQCRRDMKALLKATE